MNRFLVYFSASLVHDTKSMNATLKVLNQIGTPRPVDFNVFVVETEQKGGAIHQAVATASDHPFFVAAVEQISFRGGAQFESTLRLLDQHTLPHEN